MLRDSENDHRALFFIVTHCVAYTTKVMQVSLGGVFFSAKHVTKTSNHTVYRLFVVALCLPECGSLFPGG